MNNPLGVLSQFLGTQNGMNPISIMAQLQKSGNPMQLIQQMFGNDPKMQRAIAMVQGKSPQEVQQVALNLCQQRGIDINQVIQQARQMGIQVPEIEKR